MPNPAPSSVGNRNVLHLCINVPGEDARRDRMENQAQTLGITLRFIDGVDGRSAPLDDVAGFDRAQRARVQAKPLTKAELACAASHRRALEQFLAAEADFAVVLEDNATLADSYLHTINAIVQDVEGFDIIRLERRKNYKTKYHAFSGQGYDLFAEPSVGNGATGLLYSRAGAQKVLKSLERFWYAFDTHIGFFWRHGLRIFVVHPTQVKRSATRSIIDSYSPERATRQIGRTPLGVTVAARLERAVHEVMKHSVAPLNAGRLKPRSALRPSHPMAA